MKSVLTVGYGRNLFDEKNSDRMRLAACARVTDVLHIIVFSQKKHRCAPVHAGSLHLYPTQSRFRLQMFYDAYKIGNMLLRDALAHKDAKRDNWVISAQDPFEAGLVGYLLHLQYGVLLQVQEHGDFFGGTWWRRERLTNQIRYAFGKWLLRRADCVRAVSKRVAEHLIVSGVDARRITTLAVASDLTAFVKRDAIKDSHNLRVLYPDAEEIVLAVGRLVKEKNFASLIRAFKKVTIQHNKAQLVIVGSGSEKNKLVKLVKVFGLSARVSFIPWANNVASYMRSADIFALSSYREGWSRVIVEAMTAGLPCVVTDVGCVGDVCIDRRHGIVVPVNDTRAFTEALCQLIADPRLRHEYGEAAARDSALFLAHQKPYADAWLTTLEVCGGSGTPV